MSDATFEAIFIMVEDFCVETNRAASQMFGYTYEELIGIQETDILAEGWKEILGKKKLSGYSKSYEVLAKHKDGSVFWAEFQGKMYEYQGQKAQISAVRNISDRKAAEALAKDTESYYSTLFELSPGGILLEDGRGNILDANSAFCRMMHYERYEIIEKQIHELAHPDNRSKVDGNIKRILAGETINLIEKSIKKDGSECFIHLNEQKITLPNGEQGIISVAQDITSQMKIEQALRESEMRLAMTIRSAQLGTWDENFESGTVLRNERWAEMLGYTLDEIEPTKQFWLDLIHPDDYHKTQVFT